MKPSKTLGVALALALAAFGFDAFAFHTGGVAECEGCHKMHDAASGPLLVGLDASSTCLSCHGPLPGDTAPSSYHVMTADASYPAKMPVHMTPGGDFGWLKVDFTYAYGDNNGDGTTDQYIEEGETHGHNIVAAGYGLAPDLDPVQAPGGTFNPASLGCNSCHDPHGKARLLYNNGTFIYGSTNSGEPIYTSGSYGNVPMANGSGGSGHAGQSTPTGLAVGVYRLLWGADSPDKPVAANYTSYAVAVAPSSYNRSEASTQTRVAYGGAGTANSWGNWCGSCHPDFNIAAGNATHHPTGHALGTGALGDPTGAEATNYNHYVSSGKLDGDVNKAYTSLVPFAEATESLAALTPHAGTDANTLRTRGALDGNEEVTCLSCHRAHASGFEHMLRWDYGYEFMTKGGQYIGSDNPNVTGSRAPAQHRGRTNAWWQRAYYERPAASNFGPYNRVLCNRCHAQD